MPRRALPRCASALHELVLTLGEQTQRRHRLALRTGADDAHPLGRVFVDVVDVDERGVGNGEHPEVAAHAHVLTHAQAERCHHTTIRDGGIGDLLMMTPGLQALTMKYPNAQIDFAIPKSFHPAFEGFTAVRLLDINEDKFDLSHYHRWINLTHCPAGQVESRQYPNVRTNRIEIFARAMGIPKWRLRRTAGFKPAYRVTPDEQAWAQDYLREHNPEGRPVIGVQPFAADTYRNWPHMEALVKRLSADHLVLLFHHEDILGYDFDASLIKGKIFS